MHPPCILPFLLSLQTACCSDWRLHWCNNLNLAVINTGKCEITIPTNCNETITQSLVLIDSNYRAQTCVPQSVCFIENNIELASKCLMFNDVFNKSRRNCLHIVHFSVFQHVSCVLFRKLKFLKRRLFFCLNNGPWLTV